MTKMDLVFPLKEMKNLNRSSENFLNLNFGIMFILSIYSWVKKFNKLIIIISKSIQSIH